MPRTCTTCAHPHRDEIDRRLPDGAPLRNIAKQFSVSSASLFRHNKIRYIDARGRFRREKVGTWTNARDPRSMSRAVMDSAGYPRKHTLAAVERLDALTEAPTDTTTDTRPPVQSAEHVVALQ